MGFDTHLEAELRPAGDKADFLVLKGLKPVKVFRKGDCISD